MGLCQLNRGHVRVQVLCRWRCERRAAGGVEAETVGVQHVLQECRFHALSDLPSCLINLMFSRVWFHNIYIYIYVYIYIYIYIYIVIGCVVLCVDWLSRFACVH